MKALRMVFLLLPLVWTSSSTTLSQLYPFSSLLIVLEESTFPDYILSIHANDFASQSTPDRQERLHIKIVDQLPTQDENLLEQFVLKNGKLVVLETRQSSFEKLYRLYILKETSIAEALSFILEQILGDSPSRFGYIEACISKKHASTVMDVLADRRVKTKGLFTCYSSEQQLLTLINATQPLSVRINVEEPIGENQESRLSDAFFQDPTVQNIESFRFFDKSAVVEITDETLLKLKTTKFIVEAAPRITFEGVRRFFQASLDGKMDRTLTFAPSFKFNVTSFLKNVNVKKVAARRGVAGRWEGDGGPPKIIQYIENGRQEITGPVARYLNHTQAISITVLNKEKLNCSHWSSPFEEC